MIEGAREAIDNVRGLVEAFKQRRAIFLAATGTMVEVSKRVWGSGELTDGGKMAYDQPYELYAYTPPSPKKVSGKGKPFSEWKNQERAKAIKKSQGGDARKIKGGFYHSYEEYKTQQGRPDMSFELTGRLRKAWNSNPKEVSATEAVIQLSDEEALKYQGLTDAKGEFLQFSKAEIEAYHKRLLDIYLEA